MENKEYTQQDLIDFLGGEIPTPIEERDITKLRYVVYLRKSTNEKDKQERSLEDQKNDCMDLVDRLNLNAVTYIEESESAKESGIRPKFKQMLIDIEQEKYDGMIAWHPNRLSRNMKDAGEIIDLLDKDIIKDLQFAAHTFQNDPSGKMLLGITFVMAKQYSDNLSKVVKRGNHGELKEGKYPNKSKWGYKKDKNSRLQPDGNNFVLIKEAFQMRIENKTLEEICDYLNENKISRTNTVNGNTYAEGINKNKLSKVFKDPVYAGVIDYANKFYDFTKTSDFLPLVSVNNFMKINKTNKKGTLRLSEKRSKKKGAKADLLRKIVICSECGESLSSGINGKKIKRYYYRCENKDCKRYNKSTRANVILDFVRDYLMKKPFSTPNGYSNYRKEAERLIKIKTKENGIKLRILKKQVTEKNIYVESIEKNIAIETDIEIKKIQKGRFKETNAEIHKLNGEISDLESNLKETNNTIKTYDEFLKLMDKVANKLIDTKNMKIFDKYIRLIFLNFVVDGKNVVKYSLKAPFGAFDAINETKVSNCGR